MKGYCGESCSFNSAISPETYMYIRTRTTKKVKILKLLKAAKRGTCGESCSYFELPCKRKSIWVAEHKERGMVKIQI